jgi:8-amino-7-oxononanoate synthase
VLPDTWKRYLEQQRQEREARKLGRKLRPMRHMGPTRVQIGSHELVNFASNDYLGLAADLRVAEAAASAAGRYGWGTGASRLVTGSSTLHAKLESETATFRGTEAALVFGSGYQANLGVISAFAGPGDTVLSDALNHASIVAGCRLSGATVKIFKHRDRDELERKLSSARGTRCIVVTDTLFSIRGDAAELPQIAKLCERFNALLIVDDAHANACVGKKGRGLPEEQRVLQQVPIVVGTYSKALGSYGGFVACSESVREHLINAARPFIYTTALPIALTAANIESLKILRRDGDTLRQALAATTKQLRTRLTQAEFKPTGSYHIVGLPMDSPDEALFYAEQLEQLGLLVYPMRWPSVPEGQDTLRISLSAAHSEDDIARLVKALKIARDRTAGKETSNVNQRSSRRPTQRSLEAEESGFDIDETEFEVQDDSQSALGEPISAVDSARLPASSDLDDFEVEPPPSGGTVIIHARQTEEIAESDDDWSDVGDPGDLTELEPTDLAPEPSGSAVETDGFEVVEDDSDAGGDDVESDVQPVPDEDDTPPPVHAADEPITANIEGNNTRRTRKRNRNRRKSRTRGTND